jgi:hypothetical protein
MVAQRGFRRKQMAGAGVGQAVSPPKIVAARKDFCGW